MTLSQLQYADPAIVDYWRGVKKEKAKQRKQRELKKKAEKMARLNGLLNRALKQSHKLNVNGIGKPMRWWPVVEEWEEAVAMAKIKKE